MESQNNVGVYWGKETNSVISELGSRKIGLTTNEASERLLHYGHNALILKKKTSPFEMFINQFKSPIILILIFASLISAIVQEWSDSIIILLIIVGSSFLSFFQEFNASNAAEKLRGQISIKSTVLRNKLIEQVNTDEIVPGDIVLLSAGSLIPADGLILEANDFFVNQSVLTGETFPVEKRVGAVDSSAGLAERMNCVYKGTNVRSGSAKVIIAKTGGNTEFGKISKSLTLKPPETEFERGVREFGLMLSEIMLILVILVFGLNVMFNKPVLDSLLFSIALAVGITPQLLPAIVSINLSKGAQEMAKNGVIVKKLNAIENFGSMDVLCTDKTGTLTEGVVKLDGSFQFDGTPSENVFMLAYLNASFQNGLSNPLDDAIKSKGDYDLNKYKKIAEVPYDFIRKRLSVVLKEKDLTFMITKGALNKVIKVCSQVEVNNESVSINPSIIETINKRYIEWSDKGYRVLGVSKKYFDRFDKLARKDETDMIFIGFLIFLDPPKIDAADTITNLNKLGIELKIITGDNKNVSRYIAETIGLPITNIITGAELNKIGDEALWHIVEKTNIFTEVDPNQKERIIKALQRNNHVVGYMGDGINDAPSLHNADVGISVDQAVDVAKDAADFVLMKHDLAFLERGVKLGRITFANTMKYVNVTTSANFGNMFSMAGISILLPFLPLLPMQVLLTNFLTDFPAMMIAGDSVDVEAVLRPHRWQIKAIRKFMFVFGMISSLFDYLSFSLLLLVLKSSELVFQTGWFIESVFTELIALIILRTSKVFYKSRIGRGLLLLSLLVFLLTLAIPFIPGINSHLGFTPLPIDTIGLLIGISGIYIIANEIAKKYFYKLPVNNPK